MNNSLDLKTINDLLGTHFFIPSYQRGYRWVPLQVNDLLNDIWDFVEKGKDGEFYCLQPIVVKIRNQASNVDTAQYEVIDGQQRLTTIFIILQYIMHEYFRTDTLVSEYGKEIFTVQYETREASASFLKSIASHDHEIPDRQNIDFYYMSLAYSTVKKWFEEGGKVRDRTDKEAFLSALLGKKEDKKSTQVIWYLVDQEENGVELFRRLNMGKIPLTNSELIKALFLSSSSFGDMPATEAEKRKTEISLFWDNMEQGLGDPDFWSFCTNQEMESYPTKIELLFDLMTKKTEEQVDPLYTFLHFVKRLNSGGTGLWDLWLEIENYYLTLLNWAKDRDLYHKIGYLIAVGADRVGDGKQAISLIEYSMQEKKSTLKAKIDELIRKTVNFDLANLSYEEERTRNNIKNVLLLFNVESVRKSATSAFYPFRAHKATDWTLEHIHAQKAELIERNKKDQWKSWLDVHTRTIRALQEENRGEEKWSTLLEKVESFDQNLMTWETFCQLANEVIDAFTANGDNLEHDMHSITNLALLGYKENSALNNSVFEVKRRTIIDMDREGKYIPLCSLRVFLKYYHDGQNPQQLYFWDGHDRDGYFREIQSTLRPYLPVKEGEY